MHHGSLSHDRKKSERRSWTRRELNMQPSNLKLDVLPLHHKSLINMSLEFQYYATCKLYPSPIYNATFWSRALPLCHGSLSHDRKRVKEELEPDVNRTCNLLIWSQTHYHCATNPFLICHSSSNNMWPINYNQAQYTTQLSDLECATIVPWIPYQYVTLVPGLRGR